MTIVEQQDGVDFWFTLLIDKDTRRTLMLDSLSLQGMYG